jgi:RIO-like serine/threonine protein kinase
MKLDVNALRYLSREEFRTLQAVEVGQKNVRAVQSFSPKADRLA